MAKKKTSTRERSSKARLAQIDQQIIELLEADHPQSIRHVFYRMTDPRLPEFVSKSDSGYKLVQRRCSELRRDGRIPYRWIADMSRQGYFVSTFDSASEFMLTHADAYRADIWRESEYRCEVWTESRSIASVLLSDCRDMAVDLFPCGGFTSMSFAHDAAMLHNVRSDKRPLVVFYIGDYDPAGVLIDRSLQHELRTHLRPDIELDFRRIGINEEQVKRYDLPTKPRKKSDKRSLEVEYTVEAEAMPAHILRDLLRTEIESLLPEGSLEVAKVAEEEERNHIKRMARLLHNQRGFGSGARI